jgi:Asp-tRNA(Asn)/Glu-tRNA(Gln) amidotransferase C subunit
MLSNLLIVLLLSIWRFLAVFSVVAAFACLHFRKKEVEELRNDYRMEDVMHYFDCLNRVDLQMLG